MFTIFTEARDHSLSVCLFACLLVEFLSRCLAWHKEELISFRWRSGVFRGFWITIQDSLPLQNISEK